MSEIGALREQILANAKSMLHHPSTDLNERDTQLVVFGTAPAFVAAVLVGLKPAIEGAEGPTPEVAMRKLLLATAELLATYIPKVGAHQRNIHGGGVFDEDMISPAIVEAQRTSF